MGITMWQIPAGSTVRAGTNPVNHYLQTLSPCTDPITDLGSASLVPPRSGADRVRHRYTDCVKTH